MIRSFKKKTVAIAAVGVLAVAGVASAAVTSGSKAPTPLTGSITDKISNAALSKYPGGTLVGLESEPDGSYEAQIRKSDGSSASVTLDQDFAVTATHDGWGRGRGGHGGPGGPGGGPGRGVDTAALATSLGVTEAKLQAALNKVRPDRGDRRAELAATIAKALGVETSDVQAVLDAQRGNGGPGNSGPGNGAPGPGRGRGHDGGGELVSALATKLRLSEDKVRSALESARPDRGARKDELAAALAKELGLDTSKVESALQANRAAGRP